MLWRGRGIIGNICQPENGPDILDQLVNAVKDRVFL